MKKLITTAFLTLLILVGTCFAQNDLLSRVSQLQETARQANRGSLGCGEGTIKLVTSRGEITVGINLDPIHVFGEKVIVADLLKLLEARVESNRTGEQNSMSGKVSDLAYVILSTLAKSKDPAAIPVIAKLLDDKDGTISDWSAIALFKLAASDEELRKKISEITFPKSVVERAKGRGSELPAWVKIGGDR